MVHTTPTEPVQPGCIRLVKLKSEGRLQKGDIIETARLGKCEVVYIQAPHSICVKSADGRFFNISGLGFSVNAGPVPAMTAS